jgi:hypothetical protein
VWGALLFYMVLPCALFAICCLLMYCAGRGSRVATVVMGLLGLVVVFHVATTAGGYRNKEPIAAACLVTGCFYHRGHRRRVNASDGSRIEID